MNESRRISNLIWTNRKIWVNHTNTVPDPWRRRKSTGNTAENITLLPLQYVLYSSSRRKSSPFPQLVHRHFLCYFR
jgi:hypothetical protein